MPNLIYPRTVSIFRPKNQAAVGAVPYQGLTPTKEDALFTGLDAGVQWRSTIGRVPVGVPGDTASMGYWEVLVVGLAIGAVQDRDVVVDDEGIRYQVFGAYWTPLNYQLKCQRLKA